MSVQKLIWQFVQKLNIAKGGLFMICKNLKFNAKIFVKLILIFVISSCVEQTSNDIIEKIKTIELGMTKDEVIKILGEPRNTLEYKENGILYIAMLYEPPSRLDSTSPSVSICKETEVVVQVIVDDSGKYDKRSKSPNPCLNPSNLQ